MNTTTASVRHSLRPLFALVGVALLLATPAHADVVHFKDGRTLEGEIVEESGDEIRISTDFGTIKVERSKIDRIEYVKTPAQELAERRETLADDDAAALFDLALWARENDLRKEADALLREVVELVPSHDLANELLGRVEVDGQWLDPEEVESYLAAKEEEMRAKGLLFEDGEWLPEEEVMRRRGFARYGDGWLPRREAETLIAIEDATRLLGWTPHVTESEHFTIFSAEDDEFFLEMLHYDLESVFEHFVAKMDPDAASRAFLERYEIVVHLLPDASVGEAFMTTGFVDRYRPLPGARERFLHATNYAFFMPRPLLVLLAEGEHLGSVDDREIAITGYLSHHLGHILARRMCDEGEPPGWLEAAIAAYYEGTANYHRTYSLCEFGGGGPRSRWIDRWAVHVEWLEELSDDGVVFDLPPLEEVLVTPLEQLDSRDVGMSWSLFRYLLAERRAELRAYAETYMRSVKARPNEDRAVLHQHAWTASFADALETVETNWIEWALVQPPELPTEELGR